jgi:hypothetical protein
MADMEIVPLFGSSFSVYAPIITAIVGFITFFNIYGRLLKCFGIQDEDSVTIGECCGRMNDEDKAEIETGKKLVTGQLRRLNDILLAESRAAATNKDTLSLLPGSPSNNALGAEDDGDLELTGDDDEENPHKSDDMTGWGKDSPATSSFYSSFKSEKKEEPIQETVAPKQESGLFGSWRSKETKPTPVSAADKKLDHSSSSKYSNSLSSSTSRAAPVEKETKGLSSSKPISSPAVAASPPPPVPPSNDGWGGSGGGWDIPPPTRKGGRYG